jgi:N-acetylmuramoyl-L-alanine amidase
MGRVLKPAGMLMGLMLIVAGCSTGSRRAQSSGTPAWYAPKGTEPAPRRVERAPAPPQRSFWEAHRVPEAPRVAPPPAVVPESPPPPAPASALADTWVPLARWARESGYPPLRQVASLPLPTFALSTTNGVLLVHGNSRVANWDGLEFHLGFEPQLINGMPFVHAVDLKKNIDPLIRGFALPAKTNRVIVIDPGHGGQNTGTTSVTDGVEEKEFTLDWAFRIAGVLASNGWQAYLTRTNDVDLALSNRVAFAEEHQADLFISLHFNSAAPSQEQAGLETYCLTPAGLPSTLTRGYEDDLSLVFTNNAFDALNLHYALRLHRALLSVIGNDRGVRHARFLGVLRGQNRPAVLIEAGFLSNPREAQRIADPAFRQELAEAVAEALAGRAEIAKRKVDSPEQTSSLLRPPAALALPAADLLCSNSPADNAPLH